MLNEDTIRQNLTFLESELVDQMLAYSQVELFDDDTVLIRDGQYLKHLPVIIFGTIKVYSQSDDKELLLYYIKPKQSCIISFAAINYNEPSKVFAVTTEKSTILLLPSSKVSEWKNKFPRFNQLFLDLYYTRYLDLLETINQLVFSSLDKRLIAYLKRYSANNPNQIIKLKHHEIARDLGTAREVISRILKKLEKEGLIEQNTAGIKFLTSGD
jgi:CRP/FNR family transcriptional regulator